MKTMYQNTKLRKYSTAFGDFDIDVSVVAVGGGMQTRKARLPGSRVHHMTLRIYLYGYRKRK